MPQMDLVSELVAYAQWSGTFSAVQEFASPGWPLENTSRGVMVSIHLGAPLVVTDVIKYRFQTSDDDVLWENLPTLTETLPRWNNDYNRILYHTLTTGYCQTAGFIGTGDLTNWDSTQPKLWRIVFNVTSLLGSIPFVIQPIVAVDGIPNYPWAPYSFPIGETNP